MDKFVIHGGQPLSGRVTVNGSKNAALPILIATLLTDEPCVIENVPRLRDINTTFRLLETLGKKVVVEGHKARVEAGRPLKTRAPYDLVKQMRASVWVAGPLLARFGRVRVPLPGGCAIGLRPIDIHLRGFAALGAKSATEGGDVLLTGSLFPGKVRLRFPSVGATENIMMAASALTGTTVIENAAREPEISDLARFLVRMGARVRGAGSERVSVTGARVLRGASHGVIPDRIEAGTFAIAGAASGGSVFLEGACADDLEALLGALERSGAKVRVEKGGIGVVAGKKRPRPVSVKTAPHPGFPTDLQAPWMAYMTLASGNSRMQETVFERRFLHAAELARLGALISVDGDTATVSGVEGLQGAAIMASDIRAGAALVVAGLAARGKTEIHRVYHIDRGYERIEARLRALGARIQRVRA